MHPPAPPPLGRAPLPRLTKRRRILIALGIAAALLAWLGVKWKEVSDRGGQRPAEPFRIAGNLYYVGANDVTAFLLTGPEGHVLIDGGYPGTAPLIMASIARLGFDIRDVKVLLNSHAHLDHAGGLAALQQASGAELWVSEGDADQIASGGDSPALGPIRLLVWSGMARYPRPRVDHRFADGTTIRLGPIALTAHVTPGHTPGCTSWAIPLREGERELLAVHACSLGGPVTLFDPWSNPRLRADFEHSFRVLRSLPADILLAAHAREFGRYRKFRERETAKDPVDPFIDPDGYRRYIDSAEARFRERTRTR